ILREFGYKNCNPVTTPMDPGKRLIPLTTTLSKDEFNRVQAFPYRTIVGKCMYLCT
ncbi:hypothetical protein F5880DRAFT_1439903, partial [Lentinula raphanica]